VNLISKSKRSCACFESNSCVVFNNIQSDDVEDMQYKKKYIKISAEGKQ
jgi:hypothetical protein